MENKNCKAFLDMIAYGEGTSLIPNSDSKGYNVAAGASVAVPLFFKSYKDHPRVFNFRTQNSRAGRYKINDMSFNYLSIKYGFKDFSPETQDVMALCLIKELGALEDVKVGKLKEAMHKCSARWPSLEGYPLQLIEIYKQSGGTAVGDNEC